MSVGHLSYVSCCAPVAKSPKAVLSSLADFANEDGVAWPSVATLALHSGWSERAVQDALRLLERERLIEPVPGYVYQRRKANATSTPYRLLVTLCRWDGQPPEDTPFEKHCRHQTQKGRRSRTPSRASSGREGVQKPHPSTGGSASGEGVQIPHGRGADPAESGAGSAPEPPEELPGNSATPSSTVSPDARATPAAPPLGAPPWCRTCGGQHHADEPHVRPTPPPPGWRSSSLPVDDDVEIEDPPEGWEDEPLWTEGAHEVHPPAEHEETSA